MGRRWGASLKARIALACVLIIAASVFTAAWLALAKARGQTAQILRESEAANAQRLAAILGQRVARLQSALQSAAAVAPIGQFDDGDALALYMGQRQVTATLFATLVLVDLQGDVRVARDESGVRRPRVNLADRPHIRAALDRGASVVSDPVTGRVGGEAMLYLSVPLRAEDQRVVGALSGGLRLNSRDLLVDLVTGSGGQAGPGRPGIDAGGFVDTVVVDRFGTVLAHPDARMVMRPLRDDARLLPVWQSLALPLGATASAGGSSAPGEVRGSQAPAELIVASAGVPELHWQVLRVAPTQQMLAGFDAARTEVAAIALGVAVLAGGLILLWTGWLMRPLEQLERRARALVPGGPAPGEGWPSAGGEIGALVHALREAVQQRSQAEADTASLLRRLHQMLHTAPIGIAFTRDRRFEMVSDQLCAMQGYAESELIGETVPFIFASKADFAVMEQRLAQAFLERQEFVADAELVRRDGSHFIGELRGRAVDQDDAQAGFIWLLRDVTAERAEHRELAWSASHDALTGLANRRHFEVELQRLLPQVRPDAPAAALFIDLDHFKAINDTAGHAAGDRVLREVATALVGSVRRDELVARLGGDEFVIVLLHCDLAAAARVAEKVRAAVHGIGFVHDGQLLAVGASLGVVPIPPGTATVANVLQMADLACYAAKSEGRNCVHVQAAEQVAVQALPASPTPGDA
jgi:diguanylate cyclase (GGDEF)-like protein/PAS domain S-box-containing protein